jgi:hypothetical protein
MTDPSSIRTTLLVLYSPQMEGCRRFYSDLGLSFATEQHAKVPGTTPPSSLTAPSSRSTRLATVERLAPLPTSTGWVAGRWRRL